MTLKQKGQAMAEYVIVCAGLLSSLFVVGNLDCGDNGQTTSCVSRLLTVMHDNYDGYSSSISAVQQYGEFAGKGAYSVDPDTGSGTGNSGTGGNIGGLNPDGLSDRNLVMSNGSSVSGSAIYGDVQPDGSVLNAKGEIVGYYSEEDQTFTDANGQTVSARKKEVVQDEEGNIIYLQAVTRCIPEIPGIARPVYSWGYKSIATDKVFNSLNKEEMNTTGYCLNPSYKVVKDGQSQPGRVFDGKYFASIFTVEVSDNALGSSGELIYWPELLTCTVMVTGWDADIDPDDDKSDLELYEARIELINDSDRNMGGIDQEDYMDQNPNFFSLQPACPSARNISPP